eukprot:5086690-Prymnesium_polylepis.1
MVGSGGGQRWWATVVAASGGSGRAVVRSGGGGQRWGGQRWRHVPSGAARATPVRVTCHASRALPRSACA